MLIGPDWLISHLRKPKTQGNTAEGRSIVGRAVAEGVSVIFRCDTCKSEEILLLGDRLRHVVKRVMLHETRFGAHLCEACIIPHRCETQRRTKSSEAYKAKQAARPSWQSTTDATTLDGIYRRAAETRQATTAVKSPEERARGVVRQWSSMSEDVKLHRAKKIGDASRARWAAMTPSERSAHVKKMTRGLPRSGVSDLFKAALIREGLYNGFESEVAISGFIADEVNSAQHLIIEFYGDYFHCNPRTYTDPSFYNRTLHMTAADKWKYDRRRLAAFRKNGYRTLVVWESDWRADPVKVLDGVRRFIDEVKLCNR